MKTVEEYRNKIKELQNKQDSLDSVNERADLDNQIEDLVVECLDKVDFDEIPVPCKLPLVKVTYNHEVQMDWEDVDFITKLEDYLYGYIDNLQEAVNESVMDYEFDITNSDLEKTLIFK